MDLLQDLLGSSTNHTTRRCPPHSLATRSPNQQGFLHASSCLTPATQHLSEPVPPSSQLRTSAYSPSQVCLFRRRAWLPAALPGMWFLFCLLASARSARPLLKVTLKCRPDHTRGPSKTSRPKCFLRNGGQRARQLFLRKEKAPIAYTFRTREKHAKEEGAYYSCKEPPVRLTGTHKPASWHTLWPGEVRSQQLVRWGGHAVRRPRRACGNSTTYTQARDPFPKPHLQLHAGAGGVTQGRGHWFQHFP